MFERRLKIFLGFLCLVTAVLVLRAGQVQVVQKDQWTKAAAETMKRSHLVETVRGSILDCRGRLIAKDDACIDACVDYRAIVDPPDEKWLLEQAAERLRLRGGDDYLKANRAKRKSMAEAETENVKRDIASMWLRLAELSHRTPEQIEEARQAIVNRVEMRRAIVKFRNFHKAMDKREAVEKAPLWKRFLSEDSQEDPALEKFSVTVAEQTEAHVVVRAIDAGAQNELGKHIDQYPGLALKPSTHRFYPYGSVGSHLLGRLTRVNREDLDGDSERGNELRRYWPNDEVGRGGLEGLCERAVRGTRGKVERVVGEDGIAGRTEPVVGKDVSVSIDMELQSQIEQAFAHAELIDSNNKVEEAVLHGAAVILDVNTGQVRALVSYPTYDANRLDEIYRSLYEDTINQPLLNRATMSQLQPGSTVKPLVGLGAITQGIIGVNDGIECRGFLVIDGKEKNVGRCWVASKFMDVLGRANVAHHPVPYDAPHPTGHLTYSDALERSCNVYFETLAHRMKIDGLSFWYDRFGIGRPTGLGIAEARGRLPRDFKAVNSWDVQYKTWFSGIGQDPVAATPIQMANVAATIARNGIWMRPRLIDDAEALQSGIRIPPPTTRPGEPPAEVVDKIDLQLSPQGLAAAKLGMMNVVHGKAGTGKIIKGTNKLQGLLICGKTGTAQAGRFRYRPIDPATHLPAVDEQGKPKWEYLEPSTPAHPNPLAPWYRGTGQEGRDLNHAWFIGFAPADRPQVAFAIMVEYGGSGGYAAGGVARKALEACVDQGYLKW